MSPTLFQSYQMRRSVSRRSKSKIYQITFADVDNEDKICPLNAVSSLKIFLRISYFQTDDKFIRETLQ